MSQRIAALLALGPALDANYAAVKANQPQGGRNAGVRDASGACWWLSGPSLR